MNATLEALGLVAEPLLASWPAQDGNGKNGTSIRFDWVSSLPDLLTRLQSRSYDAVVLDCARLDKGDVEALRRVSQQAGGAVLALIPADQPEQASQVQAAGVRWYWERERLDPASLKRLLQLAAAWRNAEQERASSEAHLRAILDRFPDGLLVTDPSGRLIFANASAQALWLSVGRELGERPFERPPAPGETREIILGTDGGQSVVVECRTTAGQWRAAPVRLVFLRDITHRRRNEEQLRIASEKYKQTIRRLVSQNTEIQLFYHTLSHELKTPLAAAREFICLVLDGLAGPLTDEQREYLGIARDSCDQLRLYVNDLLDVTRLETGKLSIHRQPVNLEALLERLVETHRPDAERRQIELRYICEPNLPMVEVDGQRIQQVLTNLVANALKYTPRGGLITLGAWRHQDRPDEVVVGVKDTGPGIPVDHRERIFERLQQLDPPPGEEGTTRAGLGLGLYICRELVKLHGGRIWVDSEPGAGSHFQFTLPVQPAQAVTEVMVVDDDAGIRGFLRDFLQQEGFQVTEASGGAQALEAIHLHRPDLVVLDLVMPGMDGEETLREIRRLWADLPVIISSGYAREELLNRLAAYAPFAVVEKPYRPEMLLNTIRALLC